MDQVGGRPTKAIRPDVACAILRLVRRGERRSDIAEMFDGMFSRRWMMYRLKDGSIAGWASSCECHRCTGRQEERPFWERGDR